MRLCNIGLSFLFTILFITQVKSQNPAGDSLFNSSQIHTIKFYFGQTGWYDSLIAYKAIDKKMKGNVEVNGIMYPNVGVQFKGNSSFNNPSKKKSWKIDFNEFDSLQECNKEKTLNLHNGFKDPTFMREKITLDYCVKNKIAAPRCTYANVYVNDTLWGFYDLVEQVDKTLLKHWYADNDGNLFKGDPSGTLQWLGTSPSQYYTKYELKTNKTIDNWSDLIYLIDKINNTPNSNLFDSLEKVMETNSAMKAWAMNILFANLDSYQGSGHNYYIFHDSTYNRFNWITWDVNEAFGNFSMGMSISQLEALSIYHIPSPANSRPLENNMLLNAIYKDLYTWEVCKQVAEDFNPTYLNKQIDSLATIIRPYVYADPNKFYTNTQFETNINSNLTAGGGPGGGNIPGLKSFAQNRYNSVLSELNANNCFMSVHEQDHSVNGPVAFPNPASNEISISNNVAPEKFEIISLSGKIILEGVCPDRSINIKSANIADGIYLLRLHCKDRAINERIGIIENRPH